MSYEKAVGAFQLKCYYYFIFFSTSIVNIFITLLHLYSRFNFVVVFLSIRNANAVNCLVMTFIAQLSTH